MSWIRKRLLGGFGLVLLFLLGLSIISYISTNYLNNLTLKVSEQATINTQMLKAEIAHGDFVQNFYRMFLTTNLSKEPLGPHECDFGMWYDNFNPDSNLENLFASMNDPHQNIHKYGKEVWQLASQGKFDQAEQLFVAQLIPNLTKLRSALNEAEEEIGLQMVASIQESEAAAGRVQLLIIFSAIISLIIAVLLALNTANAISKPIIGLVGITKKAAQGNLTVQLDDIAAKGEIKDLIDSFALMIANLKGLITGILDKTAEADHASDALAYSSDETRRAAEQIAITIQGIAESGDQLSRQSDTLGEHSEDIKSAAMSLQSTATNNLQLAQSAEQMAEQGQAAVAEAIEQLTTVTETVNFATDAIQKLGMRSGEIATIVELIDGLAAQTNLLALNAAIEAARAGDSGRGFAVVAEEVRKLAVESASAAEKITSLIEDIQSETTVTINSMEVNAEEISQQMQMIETAGQSLSTLVASVHETRNSSEELLALSTTLQNSGMGLGTLVHRIGDAIIQNAAGSEEVAAAAEEQTASQDEVATSAQGLRQITAHLVQATDSFKVE